MNHTNPSLAALMPIGNKFGWGICGQYLCLELAKHFQLSLYSESLTPKNVDDSVKLELLQSLQADLKDMNGKSFPGPVLHAIRGPDLRPLIGEMQGKKRVGYTFFEKHELAPDDIHWSDIYYDHIVAGSTWCEEILKDSGFKRTSTILQGVDQEIFFPKTDSLSKHNLFIIFSGGKLELRKGQDLVIKAFKELHDKYKDVVLLNQWFNSWDYSIQTMGLSPYIHFNMPPGDYFNALKELVAANGIDPKRVINVGPTTHRLTADVYRRTDIGLFPNRCEGGTNLVLMEYMACGKPVIASFTSGHKDVITEKNSIPLKAMHPFIMKTQDGNFNEKWEEPSLDEIIAALEWAYWHRDDLKAIGRAAGEDMSKLTWQASAEQFSAILN